MDASATLGTARRALAQGVIRVDIRGKWFGATPVLAPLAFEVAAGETVALVGPSGVGKSTLLRLVAGIDTAFDGTIERPPNMAMVFQEPTLLPWRSALRNITLVHPGLTATQARLALEQVGLSGKDDLYPGQLSLGQQRRLSLARAFAGRPQALVLDEPFVSLDPETAESMIALTEALIAEYQPATLFVTHATSEADRLARRVLRLQPTAGGATLTDQR